MKKILIIGMILLAYVSNGYCDMYYVKEKLNDIPTSGKISNSSGVSISEGKSKGEKSLTINDKTTIRWSLPSVKENCFIEFWLKPVGWDATTPANVTICSFRIGDDTYTLTKHPEKPELILLKNKQDVYRYPIYSWKPKQWMKQHQKRSLDDPMWHYIHIGVYDNTIRLSIDAFPGFQKNRIATQGALTGCSLGGSGRTAFCNFHVASAAPLKPNELRNRFR